VSTIVRKSLILSKSLDFRAGSPEISPGAYQPFVFVSLGAWGQDAPLEKSVQLPAVVDTGYAGVFCLRWEHLLGWVGWPEAVAEGLIMGTVVPGQPHQVKLRFQPRGIAARVNGNLFLWNRRANPHTGQPEPEPGSYRRLELDKGIDILLPPAIALQFARNPQTTARIEGYMLAPDPRPRCPLLGVRALREHHLRLTTSGHWFSIQRHDLLYQWFDRWSGCAKLP
jgi:hypothetical protein